MTVDAEWEKTLFNLILHAGEARSKAKEAAVMLCGMFDNASSESEKMIGITAKPSPNATTRLFNGS